MRRTGKQKSTSPTRTTTIWTTSTTMTTPRLFRRKTRWKRTWRSIRCSLMHYLGSDSRQPTTIRRNSTTKIKTSLFSDNRWWIIFIQSSTKTRTFNNRNPPTTPIRNQHQRWLWTLFGLTTPITTPTITYTVTKLSTNRLCSAKIP